jgi:hypothetical protein
MGPVAHGATRDHVIGQVDLIASDQVDQEVRGFYIRLGRHPLDRASCLTQDSILIHWYFFTSKDLYFQV